MPNDKSVPRSNSPGSPEPDSFEATARRILDHALALFSEKRSLATREIREGVKCLVAHAKARGVQVEHMIIELKHACHSSESTAQHKPEVISALVTMCIHEYYIEEPDKLDS